MNDEVTVTAGNSKFISKIVIGCDGAHSVVNRNVAGTRPDPHHHCGAVRAYYSNVSGIPDRTFEIHMIKDLLPGYFWIFPVKDNLANVGLGVLSDVISKRRMNLRTSLLKVVEEVPYLNDRFKNAERIGKIEGFGLPLGSRKVPMSGERFMLCGDAASLIDPLSGEGIGQAIVSGRYAGWQAKKCFDDNNFSASYMKQYDAQVYKKFWSRHRKNYFIQQLMSREWLLNGISNAAVKSRLVRSVIRESFT
jgi:flavin-dependent dehydrogenase